jgi:peptidoglycan/LPS O-acetylase OafA/YrhL
LTPQRPTWLPKFVPELDGLRGLAVLGVIFYHCHPRFEGTPLHYASLWGWAGVNLFFVLSGFLITSILLESREKPRYFRNFYGRRALRIWPVYVLVLGIVYAQSDWFIGPKPWDAIKAAPWFAYVFFVQNLFHLALPPAIGPTWSLAIEQQYYLLWAPGVRFLRRPWMLASVLAAALVCSPLLRHLNLAWIGLNHTLIKLDGIAIGSLLALGLHTLTLSRRTWLWIGLGAFVLGIAASATVAGGTSMLDSALATAFAGAVLAAIASTSGAPGDRSSSQGWTGARSPINAMLRRGPLAFYGRISYGLYMIHIMVFIYLGSFDARMNAYGIPGNMDVVAMRLAVSTTAAAALWYGFESQILKLKRYF